jgi:hypothetical protein
MSEQPNTPPADEPAQRKRGGRPFVKGDARINRKGRPKSFEALRREAIKLAGEYITNPATGEQASIARLILESWAKSSDPQAQKLFIEYAYGKVPNKEEITGADGGANKLIIEVVRRGSDTDDTTGATNPASETGAD